jgi:adenosylmethionine-8-amino-7-oxononanoate aminotransferase
VEDVIVHEDPNTVAGVLVEPIGNTGGIITPTDEYFQILREICDRYDVLLIFDEVITGFAKTGNMFAAQTFGVTPDIICAGKGISSGAIPLGAMIARDDMAEAFKGMPEDGMHFAHGHTFAGNPLACAVGLAVLGEILDQDLCAKAERLGLVLRQKLNCLKKYGVVREIRGKGTLLGVEFVKNTKTMEPFPALGKELKKAAMEHGIVLRIDPSWFAVAPPLIAEEHDIDEMCELIDRSLRTALERVSRA